MDFTVPSYNPNAEQQRPYVRFEMRAMEDRSVKAPDGVTQMKNVAWAVVRAPGAKDSVEKLAEDWLDQLKSYAKDGRIPGAWSGEYRHAYEMWCKGEDIPVHGTPIKTWPPLSPSQRVMVLNAGILTVEDLAIANDENRARIGMGAHNIQAMANQWLEDSKEKGATAKALDAARVQMQDMAELIKNQSEVIKELQAQMPTPASAH